MDELLKIPAREKIAAYPRSFRRFDVSELIAYEKAASRINREPIHDLRDHAGPRLSAGARSAIKLNACLRMMWTILERIYVSANFCQLL
ncbi:hypothetical protein J2R73_006006 [Bradyrhizobium japonicum]|nr:hypothetical protein [Bradyrhizobium japonicum]MCP1781641.1 hypothetical protein [Bradyrhizobium japonicum]MCP1861002.1 hypothetical protein [Bradyrhizobium japonicum]MCP1891766.1 hypothetical protein [Bradyrhizobium japonicum]MCP1955368.1 hypothetical protein [Bradyrhizobium japonicum]